MNCGLSKLPPDEEVPALIVTGEGETTVIISPTKILSGSLTPNTWIPLKNNFGLKIKQILVYKKPNEIKKIVESLK